MGEYELKRLEVAIQYISRMAAGRNPVTNRPAPENEILINANVNRCLQFVGEILKDVKSTGGIVGAPAKKAREPKPSFAQTFPYEILKDFQYRQDHQISFFLKQICELYPEEGVLTIQSTLITDWLRENGYLEKKMMEEIGKENSVPTEKGEELGLYSEKAGTPPNEYYRVFYNENAQMFIIEHFREILTQTEEARQKRRQEKKELKAREQERRRKAAAGLAAAESAAGTAPDPELYPREHTGFRIPQDRQEKTRSRRAAAAPADLEDPSFSSLLSSMPAAGPGGADFEEFFGDGWETADSDLPW